MTMLVTVPNRRQIDWVSYTPLLGLAIVALIALIFAPEFFQVNNLSNLSRQASILAIIAAGQTLVLLVAGIDLSVGVVMTFSMVVVARISEGRNDQLLGALGVAVIVGLVIGSVNAFLVVIRRVPPFVATLATLVLITGVQTAWTQGVPGGDIPPALSTIGSGKFLGIPSPTILALVVIGITAILLRSTVWGRSIFATGSNRDAARVSGIPVNMVLASAYISCSLFAVLGGLVLGGYVGYVDGYLGSGYDLDSIAAAVIGGTSFAGGKGGVGRSFVGALIIAAALNVIVLTGASEWLQLVVKGAIIIAAVAVQMIRIDRRKGG